MYKVTSLLLFVVVASLTTVSAITDEELAVFRRAMAPIVAECSAEHVVNKTEIDPTNANNANKDATPVEPCFIACVLKKIGVLDDNGVYNTEIVIKRLRFFIQNDVDFAKFETVAKKCNEVNNEPVSDGAIGCDRGKLLLSCVTRHSDEMPF